MSSLAEARDLLTRMQLPDEHAITLAFTDDGKTHVCRGHKIICVQRNSAIRRPLA